MNPRLRRSAAHVVVGSLDAPVLDADDEHHLGRVLRIRPTDEISLTDGEGRWVPARWSDGVVEVVGPIETVPSGEPVAVVVSIPKGDRPEWIVQKLTEVGVDRIAFVAARRCVVRWDETKATRQIERLRRIAREAVMQSRRVRIPVVELLAWSEVVALPAVAVAEPGSGPIGDAVRTIVIGPEGGFTDEELAAVPMQVGLGETVLRVETAAMAAGVLLRRAHPDPHPT